MKILELTEHAKRIRINILKQVAGANSGHPGGSLSSADIVTALYFKVMNIDADNVESQDRDRFVMCKGHASPLLYAVLSEKGLIPEEELMTFRKINSRLSGHPDCKKIMGIDMSTGSLGQGLAVADGMAIANKLTGKPFRVYALMGDGECEEGEVWEAAMAAAHYHSDNLCAIVDQNGLQIDGRTEDVIGVEPLDQKFEAFGWHVIKIDGHDMEQILRAFKEAESVKGKPSVIIARTVKGKGVSFMENQAGWHGKAPNAEQLSQALKELEEA